MTALDYPESITHNLNETNTMYKLYSLPGTCSTGINALLTHLGEEFEVINPAQLPEYRTISPTGQVPALDDDGLIITEGAAIALYLLEKHNSPSLEAAPSQKAEFLRWLMFNYATLHPAYSKIFTMSKVMEHDPGLNDVLQNLADLVSNTWSIIDERLASQRFVVGDSATIIDYLIAIYASWGNYFPNQQIQIGDNTKELIGRVRELPEFIAAYKKEGIEYSL